MRAVLHNLKKGHRSPRSRIRARVRGLISDEGDRLCDIGIKVKRCTIDNVRNPLFIRESVFVRLASAGQATGNFAVSFGSWTD
jgi:hypothetical protein